MASFISYFLCALIPYCIRDCDEKLLVLSLIIDIWSLLGFSKMTRSMIMCYQPRVLHLEHDRLNTISMHKKNSMIKYTIIFYSQNSRWIFIMTPILYVNIQLNMLINRNCDAKTDIFSFHQTMICKWTCQKGSGCSHLKSFTP